MKSALLCCVVIVLLPFFPQLKSGPPLAHQLVKDWPQLPAGWNFGETSGVATDKQDNVWVFTRGAHPVLQFDRAGNSCRPGRTSRSSRRTAFA